MPGGTEHAAAVLREDRTWASLCHLGALAFLLLPLFGHILGPLAFWFVKRQESGFVDEHGREALNFQISVSIYAFAMLMVVMMAGLYNTNFGLALAFLLFFPLKLFWLVSMILGVIKATDGERYRYRLSMRFL